MIWPFDHVPTTTSSAPMAFQSCRHLTALGELPEPTASGPPINTPLSILLLRLPGPWSAPPGQAASRHPHRAVLLLHVLPPSTSSDRPAKFLFPDQTHAPTVHPMTLTNICKYSFCGCKMNGCPQLFSLCSPRTRAPTFILPTTASLALSTPWTHICCVPSDMLTQGSKT